MAECSVFKGRNGSLHVVLSEDGHGVTLRMAESNGDNDLPG